MATRAFGLLRDFNYESDSTITFYVDIRSNLGPQVTNAIFHGVSAAKTRAQREVELTSMVEDYCRNELGLTIDEQNTFEWLVAIS